MTRTPKSVFRFNRPYGRRRAHGYRPAAPQSWADPRRWLGLVIVGAGFGLIVLPGVADGVNAALAPASAEGCRVTKVIDGDTVLLWCPASGFAPTGFAKVRLTGLDAPEVFSPACPSEWTRGLAATWHLRRLLFQAESLTVRFAGQDRYGRRLAAFATDTGPVAGRMIADGHARPYEGGQRQGWCE